MAVSEDDRISGRVVVLPGCIVIPGSIAGTGFVVMKDVPQMTIVAETPARLFRYCSRHGSPTVFRFAKEYDVDTVSAGDMKAQGNKMTDLLLHPTKLEAGRRRSSLAAGRLSWDAIVERHVELYRRVVEPRLSIQ